MNDSQIKNIYLYLVCLVAISFMLYSSVGLVKNIVEYASPQSYQIEEIYLLSEYNRVQEEELSDNITYEQFTDMKKESQKYYEKQEKLRSLKNMISSLTILLVAAGVFLYHRRQIS